MGLLNIAHQWPIKAPDMPGIVKGRECSKKFVQQGRSLFDARSVHFVREHGKMARTPLAAFFNIPCMMAWIRGFSTSSMTLRMRCIGVSQSPCTLKKENTSRLIRILFLLNTETFLPHNPGVGIISSTISFPPTSHPAKLFIRTWTNACNSDFFLSALKSWPSVGACSARKPCLFVSLVSDPHVGIL